MAGCNFAAISTHHALEITGLVAPLFPLSVESVAAGAPWLALSVGLAAFEPGMFWLNETLRGLAAEQERHPEGVGLRAVAGATLATVAGATIAATGGAAAATMGPEKSVSVAPSHATPSNRPPINGVMSYPDPLAHARALRADDPTLSQAAIAARVGKSRQWVGKYVDVRRAGTRRRAE